MRGESTGSYRARRLRGRGDFSRRPECQDLLSSLFVFRYQSLFLVLWVAASGCLAMHPQTGPPPVAPPLRPEVFFDGHTQGLGTLRVRGRTPEEVRVESYGEAQPDSTFRLDQTITHPDGRTETRTWIMRRVDATHYTATLTDAEGEVGAEVQGNELFIRYRIGWPAITMRQHLILQPDGKTALNLSTVRVLGIPWARLNEQIRRVDD